MTDTPKLMRDMTDAEQGALLLAHHRGKKIQVFLDGIPKWDRTSRPTWKPDLAYRVEPEPQRETVKLRAGLALTAGRRGVF